MRKSNQLIFSLITSLFCLSTNPLLANSSATHNAHLKNNPCVACVFPDVVAQQQSPMTKVKTTLGRVSPAASEGWFVSLGLTLPWYAKTGANTIQVLNPPYAPDVFFPASLTSNVLYEASVGYQFAGLDTRWLPAYRVGLLYQGGGATTVSGTGWPQNQPPDQSYTGQIATQSLFVNGQLDIVNYHNIAPYIEAGLGAARHQLSNYQDTDVAYTANIPGATTLSFAWFAGTGIAYHFTLMQHELVASLGYRYMDKGTAKSGLLYSGFSTPREALSQSVRDNELNFTIRYLF